MCVLMREMGMGVHAAAPSPMHTWVRFARADDAAVAITCACVGTSAGICSQRTCHVQYICVYIYIYIDATFGYVNGYACVFLHARAIACGR